MCTLVLIPQNYLFLKFKPVSILYCNKLKHERERKGKRKARKKKENSDDKRLRSDKRKKEARGRWFFQSQRGK